MSQVDWSEAPEGATHYRPAMHCPWYLLDSRGVWFFWTGFVWSQFLMQPGVIDKLIARPSPAWSGEGLPNVEVVCEMRDDFGNWHQATVIAHGIDRGHKVALGQAENILLWCKAGHHCRPIRTPEQIAQIERAAAAGAMAEITRGARDWPEALKMLHDAGYRKQEQPK